MRSVVDFFRLRSGLQMRMTLWVVGSVAVVAVLVVSIAAMILREEYETEVREELDNDINTTIKSIDQRMVRVEYITKTAASFIGKIVDEPQVHDMEEALSDFLKDTQCVDAVTLSVAENDTTQMLYTAYTRVSGKDRGVVIVRSEMSSLADDLNWNKSFKQKQDFWCVPYTPKDFPDVKLECFSVPVYNKEGVCRGMLCIMIRQQWIEEIIKKYKTRQDIDVSVYNREGMLIVGPDAYIQNTPTEDLIVEEDDIDRLGWHVVFSASSSIVTEKLTSLMWQMVVLIVILLISMAIVVAIAVTYVARPYVMKQQHVAEAKAAMERELQIAAETQRQLVPHSFPPFPDRKDVSIHACLHPALQVGGDLYDYFIKEDVLYFCIGDVSGKGTPASLFMAATHYLFRSVADAMSVKEAVQQMNSSLCTDNEQCNFITFFFGRLNLTTGMLEYCNAGHNSPILVNKDGARFFAESENMPLGAWEEAEYMSHSMQLSKGDTVVLYTDGVTEAMDAEGNELGNDDTLHYVEVCEMKEPEAIVGNLLQCVRQHAGNAPQSDDITMLSIKINK